VEKRQWVCDLLCEGCGIRSIGRLLAIGKTSVQRVIGKMAAETATPTCAENGESYEMDELRTFCGSKGNECWVMYAINKKSGKVIDFCVGRRTKENIAKVVKSVLSLHPKRMYTDGLNIYPSMIPSAIHNVFEYCTNKIERHNLTLRTHLKRLGRKTIGFTRSVEILENCLRIYWFRKGDAKAWPVQVPRARD
jgi:IS1 family transposase